MILYANNTFTPSKISIDANSHITVLPEGLKHIFIANILTFPLRRLPDQELGCEFGLTKMG